CGPAGRRASSSAWLGAGCASKPTTPSGSASRWGSDGGSGTSLTSRSTRRTAPCRSCRRGTASSSPLRRERPRAAGPPVRRAVRSDELVAERPAGVFERQQLVDVVGVGASRELVLEHVAHVAQPLPVLVDVRVQQEHVLAVRVRRGRERELEVPLVL